MKDLLISKLREMVKIKKPKVKKTEPTEADRADFAAWQDKKGIESLQILKMNEIKWLNTMGNKVKQ